MSHKLNKYGYTFLTPVFWSQKKVRNRDCNKVHNVLLTFLLTWSFGLTARSGLLENFPKKFSILRHFSRLSDVINAYCLDALLIYLNLSRSIQRRLSGSFETMMQGLVWLFYLNPLIFSTAAVLQKISDFWSFIQPFMTVFLLVPPPLNDCINNYYKLPICLTCLHCVRLLYAFFHYSHQ